MYDSFFLCPGGLVLTIFLIIPKSLLLLAIPSVSIHLISLLNCFLSKLILSPIGIIIKHSLKFDRHTNQVISQVGLVLKKLHSLNFALPFKIHRLLDYALLMPHILYGLEISSGTYLGNLQRLNLGFNRIVQYPYDLSPRCHVSD